MPMDMSRAARAERLGPYFEVQLRFAQRMAELTGVRLGEATYPHTNLSRRFGLGVPGHAAPSGAWTAFAERLETAASMSERVALCQAMFRDAAGDTPAGRERFGCFAFDPPRTAP